MARVDSGAWRHGLWLTWIPQVDDTSITGAWGMAASSGLAGPGRGRCHRPQWVLEGNDVSGHGDLLEMRAHQLRGARGEAGTVAVEKHGRW